MAPCPNSNFSKSIIEIFTMNVLKQRALFFLSYMVIKSSLKIII